ncbi:MAG: metallophosphoesterase [Lachnospiraceae bacterium]|nr:metallophosphoesterase [Lachnospiraceae bacterium]
MKILIISDTHGNLNNLKTVLEREQPIDQLLHTGDVLDDQEQIREMAGCACAFVRGNCDFFSREPLSRDFGLMQHNIHMEHGHMLPDSFNSIAYKAESIGADILMFGHTHVPLITEAGGITILNPGSLTRPRQANRLPSYIIMTLDKEGHAEFELKYLRKMSDQEVAP